MHTCVVFRTGGNPWVVSLFTRVCIAKDMRTPDLQSASQAGPAPCGIWSQLLALSSTGQSEMRGATHKSSKGRTKRQLLQGPSQRNHVRSWPNVGTVGVAGIQQRVKLLLNLASRVHGGVSKGDFT